MAVRGQANELAQLALNIEKLAQFKNILSDLKKGYEIVSRGYGAVKDLTKGNFSIHKTFLDALMEASPAVKKYRKVGQIIEYQIDLVRYTRQALKRFRAGNLFNPGELNYLEAVCTSLLKGSLRSLDELATIITSGKVRMSDDERLRAIDDICSDMEQRVNFFKWFSDNASVLQFQRQREQSEIKGMRSLQGMKY
ncbi:TerB family tellurite resistance protein [Chitinophaga barathri]|uniref:TerB family tellurite resistance protein n=2 Tax=Chitinophaga barathri TaxID=1647451 RepID=A0A3N4M861_9BACT|nr:TerB family tellurite resistance protein [Chitinophaga barathri]